MIILIGLQVSIDNLRKLDINPEDIVAVGITNQRETTTLWNFKTGIPVSNSICEFYIKSSIGYYYYR